MGIEEDHLSAGVQRDLLRLCGPPASSTLFLVPSIVLATSSLSNRLREIRRKSYSTTVSAGDTRGEILELADSDMALVFVSNVSSARSRQVAAMARRRGACLVTKPRKDLFSRGSDSAGRDATNDVRALDSKRASWCGVRAVRV